MIRVELIARNTLRRLRVAGAITKLMNRSSDRRKRDLIREYDGARPDRAVVRVGGHNAVFHVANSQEYAHYLAEPEERILQTTLARLRPGDTVWDVGANVGLYAMLMATCVGDAGAIYAFEPGRSFFDRLCANADLNARSNVHPVKLALGARREQLQLAIDAQGLEGDHRLVRDGEALQGRSLETVDVAAGDELRQERNLGVPNLIKIDVQGAEEDVLLGLSRTLREPACRLVIYEVHFGILNEQGRGDSPLRIERHLKECGFRLKRLDRNHVAATKS